MNQAERYQKIAEFVQARLEKMAVENPSEWHDPVYRWEHTLRVAHYGGQIARAEGAHTEVVEAACLLHDVAHFDLMEDYKDHGREGARLSRPLLEGLGYTSEQVESICYAIAVHVDGKADFDHKHIIEADIVSDADNIDPFGAFRILQWCELLMGDHRALAENLEQRVEHLQDYIENNPLETPTGQQLFTIQLKRQVAFFKDLIEEYSLNKMPGS